MANNKPARLCTCHPERPHYAQGLCRSCYTNKRHASPSTSAASASEESPAARDVAELEARVNEARRAAADLPRLEALLATAKGALEDEQEMNRVVDREKSAESFLTEFPAYWAHEHARDLGTADPGSGPPRPSCLPGAGMTDAEFMARVSYERSCRAYERAHGMKVIGLDANGVFVFAGGGGGGNG